MTVGVCVTACEQSKYVWQILVNKISKLIILNKKSLVFLHFCPLIKLLLCHSALKYLWMFKSDSIFGKWCSLKDLKHLMQIKGNSSTTLGFCAGCCVKDYNSKQQFWENNDFCVAERKTGEERMGGGKGGEQHAINAAWGEASNRETIVQHLDVFVLIAEYGIFSSLQEENLNIKQQMCWKWTKEALQVYMEPLLLMNGWMEENKRGSQKGWEKTTNVSHLKTLQLR